MLVNNLGAVSDLEINIIIRDILKYLGNLLNPSVIQLTAICHHCQMLHTFHANHYVVERKLIRVCRLYANRFATSQEMAGISITIMILDEIRKQCLGRICYQLSGF